MTKYSKKLFADILEPDDDSGIQKDENGRYIAFSLAHINSLNLAKILEQLREASFANKLYAEESGDIKNLHNLEINHLLEIIFHNAGEAQNEMNPNIVRALTKIGQHSPDHLPKLMFILGMLCQSVYGYDLSMDGIGVQDRRHKGQTIRAKTLKDEAIRLYIEGEYDNPNQAAPLIAIPLVGFAEREGYKALKEGNEDRTIREWLYSARKEGLIN